ncbi:hypothetical protein KQX54_002091 [Cotesia glomerata]|uniref:Uncharacterized protein n=1 Tax=Cotesia glomerata TaxID=32391 RepID=A0AAV7ISZ3_COTGL|nr:hypothetical protein KQX54_002091 [Cotesia glomerata]
MNKKVRVTRAGTYNRLAKTDGPIIKDRGSQSTQPTIKDQGFKGFKNATIKPRNPRMQTRIQGVNQGPANKGKTRTTGKRTSGPAKWKRGPGAPGLGMETNSKRVSLLLCRPGFPGFPKSLALRSQMKAGAINIVNG